MTPVPSQLDEARRRFGEAHAAWVSHQFGQLVLF